MNYWLRGKRGGLLAFLAIAVLVGGGLGWVTVAALRLERDHLVGRAEAELSHRLQLALWRLDSFVLADLEREAGRPFHQYRVVGDYHLKFDNGSQPAPAIAAVELEPLPDTQPTAWVRKHYVMALDADGLNLLQLVSPSPSPEKNAKKTEDAERKSGVRENPATLLREEEKIDGLGRRADVKEGAKKMKMPAKDGAQTKVLTDLSNDLQLGAILSKPATAVEVDAETTPFYVTPRPGRNLQTGALDDKDLKPAPTAAQLAPGAPQTKQDQDLLLRNRAQQQRSLNYSQSNTVIIPDFGPRGNVEMAVPGPMQRRWVMLENQRQLVVLRLIRMQGRALCQLALLDWEKLEQVLATLVHGDLLPSAAFRPVLAASSTPSERLMAALPVELDPGPQPTSATGWTPLRIGLALAWLAAVLALSAVGLGGWSLLDLSERRVRFVSAVTHELRTPLTTLRLYLDMLTGGMVKEEKQKAEYLQTLNAESDRLNRLVGNVLDFSRLENHRPRIEKAEIKVADLLRETEATWRRHCQEAGKDLVVENQAAEDAAIATDVKIVQQILGNLIENACKYTRNATDQRIWLRALVSGGRQPPGDKSRLPDSDAHRGTYVPRSPVTFEVEDRGPGISRREQRTIFRPFRRGNQADVTAGGVGLGLALARRWAGLLGGKLTVCNNSKTAGACFRLQL